MKVAQSFSRVWTSSSHAGSSYPDLRAFPKRRSDRSPLASDIRVVNCDDMALQFRLRRPTRLARRVTFRLGVLQTDRNLARCQTSASVAVIFLAVRVT